MGFKNADTYQLVQEKTGSFQRFYNKIVSGSYPLFLAAILALVNSGLALKELDLSATIRDPVTLGIFFGLVFGKPLGIISFRLYPVLPVGLR